MPIHPSFRGLGNVRILIFATHAPFENLLALTGYPFVRVEPDSPGWFQASDFRPPAPNIERVQSTEAAGRVDLVIAQTPEQALSIQDWPNPKIAVLFSAPPPWLAYKLAEIESHFTFVFLDAETRAQCGFCREAEVIPVAVDINEFRGYTGEVPAVLTVCTLFRERADAHGFVLHQNATQGLPTRIVGHNEGLPEGKLASYDELREAYRRHRVYLYTGKIPLTMSMLEAMATGCPVVTAQTSETMRLIQNGLNGYIEPGPVELRRRLIGLLSDRELAARIGGAGRKTVGRLFGVDVFRAAWQRVIQKAMFRR